MPSGTASSSSHLIHNPAMITQSFRGPPRRTFSSFLQEASNKERRGRFSYHPQHAHTTLRGEGSLP